MIVEYSVSHVFQFFVGVNSLGVFHGQELQQFNMMSERVKSSCYMLGKALKGYLST